MWMRPIIKAVDINDLVYIDSLSGYDDFLFRRACEVGNLKVIQHLVDNDRIDVDLYRRLIINASQFGHLEVVKYLHEETVIEMCILNEALRHAHYNNHIDIIEFLEGKGANKLER